MENYILNLVQRPFIYNLQQNLFGANELKRLVIESEISMDEIDTVLDVGCGIGDSSLLFQNSKIKYLGIDSNKTRIDYAKKHFQNDTRKFLKVKVQEFNHNKVFDLVICFGLIHHLSAKDAVEFLNEITDSKFDFKKIIFLDPVKIKGQNLFVTLFHKLDIGQNIKTQDEYKNYFQNQDIKSEIVYSNKIIKLPVHKVTISKINNR